MAELNGGQLAILLQNWNHPIIKPFLATAAAGLAAIAVYERGLPIDLSIKRLNHLLAHIVGPELGRGLYVPKQGTVTPSPNYPTSKIFGPLKLAPFPTTKITAHKSAPELLGILDHIGSDDESAHLQNTLDFSSLVDHIGNRSTFAHFQVPSNFITPSLVLPSHVSGMRQVTSALPLETKAQITSIDRNGSILALAASIIITVVAIFSACKTSNNLKKAKAQKLTDAQLIAYLMLKLDEFRASKLYMETTFKTVENNMSKSNNDRNQLIKRVSGLTIECDKLIQALEEAKEESSKNPKLIHETIERVEAEQGRISALERDRNTQMQGRNNLQDELFEVQSALRVLRDEKSNREREAQEQLQAVQLKKEDFASQLQSANIDKTKLVEQLHAARLENGSLNLRLQSANADKTKLEEQLAASELAVNDARQEMEGKIDELDLQNTDHEIRAVSAEEELEDLRKHVAAVREKDSEAEVLRQQTREANAALSVAQDGASQLEKEKTTNNLPKLSVLETGREYDNDDLGNHATGSDNHSQQGSSQQQGCSSSLSESPSAVTTAEEVYGEHAAMLMTQARPPFGDLNLPNRKRREHWHSHWNTRNMMRVYRDDEVHMMELPCFDPHFKGIGIALPAENHEDRTLESGKVLEHTKCNHCLHWYTKKDMYDHLKTCKAFWELAIRCGHCKGMFKYNTAFFDQHVPNCKAESTEENGSEKHYTLAISGFGATTTQTSRKAGLSSNTSSISTAKQIKPDAPIFTPESSTSGLKVALPTGPRYQNSKFQQARGTPFNRPQVARSSQSMPYMTPRSTPSAHGFGFGTPSLVAHSPTGPHTYSARRDNSVAYESPRKRQQGRPQTPENSFPFSPGYAGRK